MSPGCMKSLRLRVAVAKSLVIAIAIAAFSSSIFFRKPKGGELKGSKRISLKERFPVLGGLGRLQKERAASKKRPATF